MVVRIDAVGMCDEAAMAWITAVTGVAISPPASADSTFTLHYDPAGAAHSAGSSGGGGSGAGSGSAVGSAGAGQVDPLGQAVELLRLHSVVGPLCTRTRYLIFTLWRFAGEVADGDGGELGASATAAAQMTPNHPHLRIDLRERVHVRCVCTCAHACTGALKLVAGLVSTPPVLPK